MPASLRLSLTFQNGKMVAAIVATLDQRRITGKVGVELRRKNSTRRIDTANVNINNIGF
jgi:hypothetical protein